MSVVGPFRSILMFGGPGTGKGTQGVVLGQIPNLAHFAMGDIFRALDKESEMGKEFLSYATQGRLVPDEFTVRLLRRHLEQQVASGQLNPDYHVLILDGIPRTLEQVKLIEDFIIVNCLVHLIVDDTDALIARLSARAMKENRPDDADPAVIQTRIEVYERQTKPVLDAYPKKLIARVNGDQPPLAVLRDVAQCLVDAVPAAI